MDVVVFNPVVVRAARFVAPRPSHRNPRVPEIADFISSHIVERRASEPHSNRASKDPSTFVNEAVGHGILLRGFFGSRGAYAFADAHATRPKIEYFASHDTIFLRAGTEPKAIIAHMADLAVLHHAPPRTSCLERGVHRKGRLRIAVPLRFNRVVGMAQRQAVKCQKLDKFALCGFPRQHDQLLRDRRDDFGIRQRLARHRYVG